MDYRNVFKMNIALFMQTTPDMIHKSMIYKILTSEFWATIEWIFIIPAQRIGYTFLNPAQLALSSYFFDFMSQIISNKYWLKLPTTIDDYCGMVLIIIGMFISKFKVFG